MDEIRRRIAERLKELNKSQRWLSGQLGQNHGYINEYLNGTVADIPYEYKLETAKLLGIDPHKLGVAPIQPGEPASAPGFSDDAAPFEPPPHHFLGRSPAVGYFKMRSRALDEHPERIMPGSLLAFDLNVVKPEAIDIGRIVVVQLYDKRELTKSFGTIIRQFFPLNKLVTNSSDGNEIIRMDDPSLPFEAVIKGALISIVREVN
jgi:hypothetical protein